LYRLWTGRFREDEETQPASDVMGCHGSFRTGYVSEGECHLELPSCPDCAVLVDFAHEERMRAGLEMEP
jgi:hypothetical protein